jgi:hypothetical protein
MSSRVAAAPIVQNPCDFVLQLDAHLTVSPFAARRDFKAEKLCVHKIIARRVRLRRLFSRRSAKDKWKRFSCFESVNCGNMLRLVQAVGEKKAGASNLNQPDLPTAQSAALRAYPPTVNLKARRRTSARKN